MDLRDVSRQRTNRGMEEYLPFLDPLLPDPRDKFKKPLYI